MSVAVFLGLAFGLSWLLALPLWLGDGLASGWFLVVSIAVMATPAIAALVVVFFVERPEHKAQVLGLWPLKPARPLLGYAAAGVFGAIALVLAALPIGALFGVYPADIVHFSGFQQVLDEQVSAAGMGELPVPTGALVALQLAALPLAAVINLIPALGEELGWRGWLFPRLMPLGAIPAILISGVIWGVWHAPLILRSSRLLPPVREGRRTHRHHTGDGPRLERLDRTAGDRRVPPGHREVHRARFAGNLTATESIADAPGLG
ncbi:CPBP family intramembrane glutamic endopeptidase [Actinoplanes derwentensis]|uniref:CAAX protease self-immunity n=1 Tax=Actinoplanes derwentensis TaxID=113562 RepID=A0A1H1XZ81_9ACTN|nr:CPBP family intramembrane glutamic endopeptidase [Actinoplanes derwentensis]GID89775.1 hypothetical protein Ade03nite_86990 [Actinoplanes derwentensis]SDT14425.1 CAAX protease self-immunity [Actinoplanes derwentensis]